MDILVIPDLHGKDNWKKVVENHKGEIVFLGDYVDDYPPRTDDEIVHNLIDIISFKKENPDRVKLLLGNHDIQYIYAGNKCPGYRDSYSREIGDIFYDNLHLFQFTYKIDGYVFSHAGISKGWLEQSGLTLKQVLKEKPTKMTFASMFDIGIKRGGDKIWGGPFWADMKETSLFDNSIKGIQQIVGHTKVPHITILPHIVYTDCLDEKLEYFNINF